MIGRIKPGALKARISGFASRLAVVVDGAADGGGVFHACDAVDHCATGPRHAHPGAHELVESLLVVLPVGKRVVALERRAPALRQPRGTRASPGRVPCSARGPSERGRSSLKTHDASERGAEAVGVEEDIRACRQCRVDERPRVAQERHVDVGEQHRYVVREQRAKQERLGAAHLSKARRTPRSGLVAADEAWDVKRARRGSQSLAALATHRR